MDDEEDVAPKLGKSRARDSKKIVRYGARIVAAARLAGRTTSVRSRRFDGSRMGRGASIGRVLSSRDRFAGIRARRAIVKTRLVRLGAKGLAGARAHLRYIQRDGVTREGTPGELYSAERDTADGKAFLQRCDGDRHQFRFIVSAEDGSEYPDLTPVKLTVAIPPDLAEALASYAALYKETYQQEETVAELVPAMLRAFLESDRGFAKARATSQAR